MSIADKLLTIAENQKKVYDAGVFDAGYAKGYDEGVEKALENPPYPTIMDGRTKLQYFYQDLVNWEDKWKFIEEYEYYEEVGFSPIGEVPFPKGTQHIVDFSNFALVRGINPNSGYHDPSSDEEALPATAFTGTLDVSNATSLKGAFSNCTFLENIGNIINTSKVADWGDAFRNCNKLKTICPLDLSSATNVTWMFGNCMELANISLSNIPTLTNCRGMFSYCKNLKTIPTLTVTASTDFTSTFNGCSALENITFDGVIGTTGISFSGCPLLTHDSLMSIINALETKTSGTFKITLGSTNLAKLTDEEKLIITNKGWQVT